MKQFGHQRPERNEAGEIVGFKPSPARAITFAGLSCFHGPDRGRKLVVSLEPGDLITIRPAGTRRTHQISAFDVYAFMLRSEANRLTLERARARKAKRAARLAAQRQLRAERKLFGKQ